MYNVYIYILDIRILGGYVHTYMQTDRRTDGRTDRI